MLRTIIEELDRNRTYGGEIRDSEYCTDYPLTTNENQKNRSYWADKISSDKSKDKEWFKNKEARARKKVNKNG